MNYSIKPTVISDELVRYVPMPITPPVADNVSNVIVYASPVTAGFLKELKLIENLVCNLIVFFVKLKIVIVPEAESALHV